MMSIFYVSRMRVAFLAPLVIVWFASGPAAAMDITGWDLLFAFHYDYTLEETAGLQRENEPVEITLSVSADPPRPWQEHIRVVCLEGKGQGVVVPHQLIGEVRSRSQVELGNERSGETPTAAPVESVNIVFLASCPKRGNVTYRLFWGLPAGNETPKNLPGAVERNGLRMTGVMPSLEVSNEYYAVRLDGKSGAIATARLSDSPEADTMSFAQRPPIHFGVDVWSPPESWDHDYDWLAPPNQRCDSGPIALRYHRWGPLQKYPDVIVSITYTFYAHVPYVVVSSTMEFTAARSARAVRMGEIVVSHSHKDGPNDKDADGKFNDVFTHYAWPDGDGVSCVEVNAHRDAEGSANLEGVASGALAILDRDVPWVAGYHAARAYGLATLRKSQFAGNRLGNPIPQAVQCTYLANYGWGFTYWSRPMVYPFGARQTAEDQNTAIAPGTIFATEEALLIFKPDAEFVGVREVYRRFVEPLRLRFKGTGPW